MDGQTLGRLRAICLAMPDATEKLTWGEHPTFRVRDRIFAQHHDNHHRPGRVALWCKAAPGIQDALVGAAPERFFVPPYVGHHGWLGLRLDGVVDWDEVASLVEESYRLTAPKRAVAELDRRAGSAAEPGP